MKKLLTDGSALPYFKKLIKCPRNYVLKPGCQPFLVKPHPMMSKQKEMKTWDFEFLGNKFKIRNWQYVKDANGNKIQDFRNFYQPDISAAEAIERIYDPLNPICANQCKGRCLEGQTAFNWKNIKRLNSDG